MRRVLQRELLDELPPTDPRAVGSRADLRRLNSIMGHQRILSRALRNHLPGSFYGSRRLRLTELGAGDGTLLLGLAKRWSALGITARVTLVDQQDLVSAETLQSFTALNWSVDRVRADVFEWMDGVSPTADLVLANLFLHHFSESQLRALMSLIAVKSDLLLACEPCRSPLAAIGSRLLWLLGCNSVTQHDAVVSVNAGFVDLELSALWPRGSQWNLSEYSAGLFSHCFIAKKNV